MENDVKVGRPPRPMPDPIPDTPENIAKALLSTPQKKADEWVYLKVNKQEGEDGRINREST